MIERMLGSATNQYQILYNMLSLLMRNCLNIRKITFMVSNAKNIYERTRKIYDTQGIAPSLYNQLEDKKIKLKQQKLLKFQQILTDVSRETSFLFNSVNLSQRKIHELSDLISRHTNKLVQSCKPLDANMLINYIEVIKNMCLVFLSQSEHIQIVYQQLILFLRTPDNQKTLREFTQSLCKATTSVQQKIRAVCLLHEMTEEVRNAYLQQIVPLIRYFKSSQIIILLYQKWRYKYKYTYQLLNQIHNNQLFVKMSDIQQSYFKLLFIQSNRGQFSPSQESIYAKVMLFFQKHTGPLQHSKLSKLIKMLHSQSFFVHSDISRSLIEYNLNNFINIAKNQNYDKQNISISQMVEIYLGFELSYPGEILLNQITEVARNIKFKITKTTLPLYQKLIHSVLKNIQKKIKYERRDTLNKQYTNDTLQFLKQFLPKYIQQWPQVIFQINNAANQLFPSSSTPAPLLLNTIEQVFAKILAGSVSRISLKDPSFTLKVLRFVVQYRDKGNFVLPRTLYSSLLSQILQSKQTQSRSLQQLQILYLSLTLIERSGQKQNLKKVISEINTQIIERQIKKELGVQTETGIINSLGHNIIWLSLCTTKIMSLGININESAMEVFVNQKLFYMINSLQYLEVYQILVMTLKIDRLRPQIYEKLMYNLSTFIIYISTRNSKSTTQFYLNHRYLAYYQKICRLVLSNKHKFKPVVHKDCFKVLQIMLFKKIAHFNNEDLLDFLDILAEPSFLSISIQKLIQHIRFTAFQLQPYSSSEVLRSFQYYNPSLLRYYEGKYDEIQIKKRLRGDTLTKRQIQQYFSKTQVYKTIIMNGDLNIRFEVPEPQTHLSDFKCIYICHRIFQRIKMFNNYDFNEQLNYKTDEKTLFNQVDLQHQKSYIDRQQLIPQISQNQLKIQNRSLPKYIKLQVWKTFVFFDKDCAIDAKDLYLNNQKLTDEILTKVIKGVYGSYEKVREVIKEFSFNQQLLNFVQESNIAHINHGAALEIRQSGVEQPLFTLLWANNTNYKIIYICAHLIAQKGFKVAILKQSQKLEGIMKFLKQNYTAKEDNSKKVKQQSEVQP